MIRFLFCILFLSTASWASDPGIFPVPSLDFNSSSDDLASLTALQSVDIVALGESIHTNGSYHLANTRAARFLIEKLGYRKLLLETPWAWARVLNKYVHTCQVEPDITESLRVIFPQFSSQELLVLYRWVREFNCHNPNDQVQFHGFDIQQISFSNTALARDVQSLGDFVFAKVPTLKPRLNELKKCGPGPGQWDYPGPSTDTDLTKCHQFLSDAWPWIELETADRFDLESAAISLRYSALQARYASDDVASNGWRDFGMAEMVQHIVGTPPVKTRAILIAHLGHAARNFQKIYDFSSKSMGTYLDQAYQNKYFVLATLSYSPQKSSWWKGEVLYQPSKASLEGILNDLGIGSLLLDFKASLLFPVGQSVEVYATPGVIVSNHWDAVMFIPASQSMTDVPGVPHP